MIYVLPVGYLCTVAVTMVSEFFLIVRHASRCK